MQPKQGRRSKIKSGKANLKAFRKLHCFHHRKLSQVQIYSYVAIYTVAEGSSC